MDGHTSVTMYGIVHRIVLDGCVVDLSLLHIVWCFVANSGLRVQQKCKNVFASLASHVRTYWVWHATIFRSAFIGLLLGWVAGAGTEYLLSTFGCLLVHLTLQAARP